MKKYFIISFTVLTLVSGIAAAQIKPIKRGQKPKTEQIKGQKKKKESSKKSNSQNQNHVNNSETAKEGAIQTAKYKGAEAAQRVADELRSDRNIMSMPEVKPTADNEITDVITSQIVLTTLSEKHYGSPWFWVYIYEENKERGIIKDLNNISPGTRVVIPPANKYDINPNDKESLKKAQLKPLNT